MADDVQGSLETAGRVGKQVGIVGDTDHSDVEGAYLKAKVGVAEGHEAGVHVHLEVTAGTDMSLPVALVLLDLPAELVL